MMRGSNLLHDYRIDDTVGFTFAATDQPTNRPTDLLTC
jgi:hypothetical protein